MASVAGSKSRSIYKASDEAFDNLCGPCKNGNVEKEAKHYCQVCAEYLCDSCRDYHRRLSATANHKILSGSKLPPSTARAGTRLAIYCSCNRNQEVAVYCEDHQYVVCTSCQTVKHRKCKTGNVQQKCVGYTSSRLSTIMDKTKSLKSEFDRLLKERTADVANLAALRKSCESEIAEFRKAIEKFLDSLEQKLLNELNKQEKMQQQCIDRHISSLTTAIEMFASDCKHLEGAKQGGRAETMFTADIQVNKNLMEYNSMLRDVENDSNKPSLGDERNKILEGLKNSVSDLGCIVTRSKGKYNKAQKPLLNVKIQSVKKVSAKDPEDRKEPWITGCAFLPNDDLVLCDYRNNTVKVLDSKWEVKDRLEVKYGPWSLSVVSENKVIITVPTEMHLQYLEVFPHLKFGSIIKLHEKSENAMV